MLNDKKRTKPSTLTDAYLRRNGFKNPARYILLAKKGLVLATSIFFFQNWETSSPIRLPMRSDYTSPPHCSV